jgi:hypothetical protein
MFLTSFSLSKPFFAEIGPSEMTNFVRLKIAEIPNPTNHRKALLSSPADDFCFPTGLPDGLFSKQKSQFG